MPQLEVKTVSANQVWASPDGQRKIYEVQLEYEGKPVKAKTYSDAIATPGWQGTVDTYEKEGRNGSETFVKQPPKEGGSYSGSSGSQGGYKGGSKDNDPFTMYLSYAKDLAVALIGQGITPSLKKFEAEYAAALSVVEAGGAQLYAGREAARAGTGATQQAQLAPVEDKVVNDVPDEITIEDLSSVMEGEPVDPGETPWPPTS